VNSSRSPRNDEQLLPDGLAANYFHLFQLEETEPAQRNGAFLEGEFFWIDESLALVRQKGRERNRE
jgi:hypothetical protein